VIASRPPCKRDKSRLIHIVQKDDMLQSYASPSITYLLCHMTHSLCDMTHSNRNSYESSMGSFFLLHKSALLFKNSPSVATVSLDHATSHMHCNTLQNIATHCKRLQHTATQYNTLFRSCSESHALQHVATQCNTLQDTTIECKTVLDTA